MSHRKFAASLALAALNAFWLVGPAAALDLQRPSKLHLTPLGNLLVAENGTAASPPNVGRVSIVDSDGNQRTLIGGLPSAPTNAANTPSGPSGLFLQGRTLYVAVGEGNVTLAGPVPRTEIPNPNPHSPMFSCVLAVHFSAAAEQGTTGIALTLEDHFALKNGETIVRSDAEGHKFTVKVIVDFPDYVSEPLPILATNVRHSHPYGVVADDTHLYVNDGGYNVVHKAEIATGANQTLVSFPRTPNPGSFGPPLIENVPTSIRWSGGKLVVSVLSGFPFIAGFSQVQEIDPVTGAASAIITGLASAVDLVTVLEDDVTVGYIVVEYSLAHLAGGPGRVRLFDASGVPIAVVADGLRTPSCVAYDKKTRTVIVGEISTGALKTFALPN